MAEQDYLIAYKWNLADRGFWTHRKVNVGMSRPDAIIWTKNHPEIGW